MDLSTVGNFLTNNSSTIGALLNTGSQLYGQQNAGEAISKASTAGIGQANTTMGNINSLYKPQTTLGNGAMSTLGSSLGINGKPANYNNFLNMPGYQFAVQQGTQAIQRQAAAMGSAYTPNTAQAVGQYVTGTAMQDYNTYISQLQNAAGFGASANQELTGANLQTAGNIEQLGTNAGMAQAGMYAGVGQTAGGLAGGGVNGSGVGGGGSSGGNGLVSSLIGKAGHYISGLGSGGLSGGGMSGFIDSLAPDASTIAGWASPTMGAVTGGMDSTALSSIDPSIFGNLGDFSGAAAGGGAAAAGLGTFASGAAANAAVGGALGTVGAQTAGTSAAIAASNAAALGGSGAASGAAAGGSAAGGMGLGAIGAVAAPLAIAALGMMTPTVSLGKQYWGGMSDILNKGPSDPSYTGVKLELANEVANMGSKVPFTQAQLDQWGITPEMIADITKPYIGPAPGGLGPNHFHSQEKA